MSDRIRPAALLSPCALLALAALRVYQGDALCDFGASHLRQGLSLLIPRSGILHTTLAAVLASVPLGAAYCLWRQRRRPDFDTADRVVVMSLAAVLVPGLLFAVLLGLNSATLGGVRLGLGVVALGGLAALVRELRLVPPAEWFRDLGRVLLAAAGGTGVLALGGVLSVHLGQDFNWDMRSYHYFNVYAWLNDLPTYRLAVAGRESFFNPLLDVPFYFLHQHLPPVWVGFLLGATQALTGVFAFGLAYKVFKVLGAFGPRPLAAALLCATAGVFEPSCLTELGTTFSDNVLTGLILASLMAVVCASAVPEERRGTRFVGLAGAGAMAGLAAGLKLTFAIYAAAGTCALVLTMPCWRGRLVWTATYAGGVLSCFLLVNGFWMLKLYLEFGSPTFPFFNSIFRSPYGPPTEMEIPNHPIGSWSERLLAPFSSFPFERRPQMEVPFADVRLGLLLALIPVAVVAAAVTWTRRRRYVDDAATTPALHVVPFLFAFAGVSSVLWFVKFHILRYFCPVLVLTPLLTVLLLRACIPNRRPFLAAAISACFLIVGTTKVGNYGRDEWTHDIFKVQVTEANVGPNALVILTWTDPRDRISPYSHLLTLFSRDTLFVNLDSVYLQAYKLREEVANLIATHAGPIYLLAHSEGGSTAGERLTVFGLSRRPAPVGRLEALGAPLNLWEVVRVPAVAAQAISTVDGR
jgi:hypothetical protein